MHEPSQLVIRASRALAAAGLGDMVWGHASVRDPDGRGVWMKASGWVRGDRRGQGRSRRAERFGAGGFRQTASGIPDPLRAEKYVRAGQWSSVRCRSSSGMIAAYAIRFAYLAVSQAFAALRLLLMSDREKDVEILALRHQLAIVQR
ncbi:MAG TPA: hypothetical protein VHX38_37220 [Pseudonocardiaceae bacterium]|nr:hypothetical protein [Pseudonocardiaceae bacterium]